MTGHVEHIVDAPHDPEIAVKIAIGRVPGEVIPASQLFRKIGFLETFGITPQGAGLRWKGPFNDEKPSLAVGQVMPRFINNCCHYAGQRQGAGTRSERYSAG